MSHVIASTTQVYKVVDGSTFSHRSGIVNQHRIELVQAGDKQFKLLCYMLSDPSAAPEEVPLTDDYQLQPPLAEAVAREAFTIKADNQSVKEVVAEGAFGGEDALLYNFQLKRDQKTTIMQRLGLAKGSHPVVRLAFEEQEDALNWYALIALCLGTIKGTHDLIAKTSSGMVREASQFIVQQNA